MSRSKSVPLASFMATKTVNVNPANFPDEEFDLYSIPAFDAGRSELVPGRLIGSPKQVVQPGDVLLSKIIPHIRRCWIVGESRHRRIVASGEWIVFRPSGEIDGGYLRHILLGDEFHAQFMNTVAGVGGSLVRARPAVVAQIKIPLPPLSEQRRIAQVLGQVDALRAKRGEAMALLDDLAQSIFLDMFGDPARNPMGWPLLQVGDLVESASYGTSAKAALQGTIPVLRMNNITPTGDVDLRDLKYMEGGEVGDRYRIRQGDILFNRTNSPELVGKTAIYRGTEPLAYAGYLVRVRTNEFADPEYLTAFLNSKYAKRVLRGMCKSIVGMANINAKELQSISVARPPITIQQEFARRVALVESLKAVHKAHLHSLDDLFDSVRHRAFRGELWADVSAV